MRADVKTRSSFHDLPALPKEVKPSGVMCTDAMITDLLCQTCSTEHAMKQSMTLRHIATLSPADQGNATLHA